MLPNNNTDALIVLLWDKGKTEEEIAGIMEMNVTEVCECLGRCDRND